MKIKNLSIKRIYDNLKLKRYHKKHDKYIKLKKEKGLTDEERLAPSDIRCDYSLIDRINILSDEIRIDEKGEYHLLRQVVTYIDGSESVFNIERRSLPVVKEVKKMVK